MGTRSIKELLILLRDNARVKKSWFGLRQRIKFGLCREASHLHIDRGLLTWVELNVLWIYIDNNRPTYKPDPIYGWKPKLWRPRKRWLNKQINNL